jgi:hypothetical protein
MLDVRFASFEESGGRQVLDEAARLGIDGVEGEADLAEPDRPVMTVRLSGIATSIPGGCARVPWTVI